MLPYPWIEKQVFSLALPELRRLLGVWVLRMDRHEICQALACLVEHQATQMNLRHLWTRLQPGIGYAGFMKRLGRVARLVPWLFAQHQRLADIGKAGLLHSIDSTLLPIKTEASITPKDWKAGRVTLRKKDGKRVAICGEKGLVVINQDDCIVHAQLMPSINHSDMNVLKQPMILALLGLRHGLLLADRGFSCRAVWVRFDGLRQTVSGFTLRLISPPHPKSKTPMPAEDRKIYRKRWRIEEVFRQAKSPHQPYHLTLTGLRQRVFLVAKFTLACLFWNWSKLPL